MDLDDPPAPASPRVVDRDDVAAAHARIAGLVRRTPVVRYAAGTFGIDVEVVAKLDQLQLTGSFKARGAASLLTAVRVPAAGVVAASGGNFGLAVAWAAARLGHRATVVVPSSSPPAKLAAFDGSGADLRVVDGYYADALAAADAFVAETGALRAHAYDQRQVVAGQGTAAVELDAQLRGELDTVLVACGGGGLLAGVVGWLGDRCKVVAVETEATPTLHAALAAGTPVDVEVGGVAASSLGARRIGDLAWAARERIAASVLVPDDVVRETQRRLWAEARVVAEPGGAAALAALVGRAYVPDVDERVAVLVCGANTDPAEVAAG
jgi:threonine dehydratase